MEPKYPNVALQLTGEDGNAFAILGRAQRTMKKNGISEDEQALFINEVRSSRSYDDLLCVCMKWFDVR